LLGCLPPLLGVFGILIGIAAWLQFSDGNPHRWETTAIAVGCLVLSAAGLKLIAYLSDRQMAREGAQRQPESSAVDHVDPVIACPNCGNAHSRIEVIAALKTQSPEMFMFSSWSTRFKCRRCSHEIPISGARSN